MYEAGDKSVYAVLSKEKARDGYMRYPAVRWNRRKRAFLCPDCGKPLEMEISDDGVRYTVDFDAEYGVVENTYELVDGDYNSNRRTTKRRTKSKKLPGVSPLVYSRFLLEYTTFLSLTDMGKDLPDYEEIPVPLKLPEKVYTAYKKAENILQTTLKSDRKAAQKLFSAYLNLLTVYPDQPYDQPDIIHPLKCVNLKFTKDGLRAAVSNGSCIVTAKGDEKSTGDISLLLPAPSLDKLARMCGDKEEFRVGTTGKSIVFLKENFAYSARLLEGEYIDTDGLIGNVQNQFLVLTDVSELRSMTETASCVDPGGRICLRFEGERLIFHCSGEQGTTSVECRSYC